MPGAQLPAPSQRPAVICVDPVQVGDEHAVPLTYFRHPPLPSHVPSAPQVAAPLSAHWPSGSAPAGTGLHTPSLPATAHE